MRLNLVKWCSTLLIIYSIGCVPIQESAVVTEVTDGDTITIEGGARVRLLGINAPERGEVGYREAKEFLEKIILLKKVSLEADGKNTDVYNRLLRHVFVNDTLVSESLAEQGLVRAKYYTSSQNYRKSIAQAEESARTKNKGLWNTT